MTLLPRGINPATLASLNGWAVPAKSTQADAAMALARYLTDRPVHAGWTSILPPAAADSPAAICHEALSQALVPRIDGSTAHMAQFLDQQINQLAHSPAQTPEVLFAKIQSQLRAPSAPPAIRGGLPPAPNAIPAPKVEASSQVREL
jgi:ABC-type glycerol-3-phosphate transport system substrate-binding protein